MAKERERKYMVVSDSYREIASGRRKIRQGYLCRVPERTVRVRIADGHGFLTVKGKNHGDTRLEFEYEVPYSDAEEMLDLCEGRIVEKTRWLVPFGGLMWEVDEFGGDLLGLVVAEVELPDKISDYPLPPFVGKEVTGNPAYYNSAL